ncbi:MAG: TRAP transporter small permease subunit [Mesorhizobium sp.]|uniref:TRAP transporter small permease subunit n=1 Tax=Mesorhizobium sp. M2A.F.Ca.ET.067.02.1.1 TaxID=2496749 RepID=UPI000FD5A558|nr:TRAP transporter small permease subunit [Mesorhizobium sp. M2A.F.Ca.ET.067.02.1.1]RUW80179.1 TRAP transporter small permease subunit [Mesorhizobium sp. M2A.F.Ca.ET.067.02.1.1]TIU58586.1 MAG: TRAP transporter small permease subunit [Mesorhizobium sp.]TIW88689.1 MAG: TRAP transporter small permease subunit [Mesorhizobium sp.]
MPSLTFVLPHWLYWSSLLLFPLAAVFLVYRDRTRPDAGRANLFLAYFFLITAGFLGMHRFYLKSRWGFLFIPFFIAVIWTSAQVRDEREAVSLSRSEAEHAERVLTHARADVASRKDGAADRLAKAEADAAVAHGNHTASLETLARSNSLARIAGILLGLVLVGDAFLMPGLVRRARRREARSDTPDLHPIVTDVPVTPIKRPLALFRPVDRLVKVTGELVAYWAVLAVIAYYYEVVARYVFNSPTNWVHESMFLMFGMQYMLAGAYAYRDETHVRVDIVYSHLSERGRAICDIITSAFFFLFTGTMLVTGWRFASDSMAVGERSFTEWGIQYWPVKLAIPIGAALLLLQGLSRLLRDIATATKRFN